MDWQQIVTKARLIKEHFDRSYKCLNTDRPTGEKTVEEHLDNLFTRFEQIRALLDEHYPRPTTTHRLSAEVFFTDIRDRLSKLLARRNLSIELPLSLHDRVTYWNTKTETKLPPTSHGTVVLTDTQTGPGLSLRGIEQEVNIETSPLPGTVNNSVNITEATMPQTITEFLGLASKLLPDFDGKPENLQGFLDALTLFVS